MMMTSRRRRRSCELVGDPTGLAAVTAVLAVPVLLMLTVATGLTCGCCGLLIGACGIGYLVSEWLKRR